MQSLAIPRGSNDDNITTSRSHPQTSLSVSSSTDSLRLSRHQHSSSIISERPRNNRRSITAYARDKTSSAIANLASISTSSTPSLRLSASSGSLARSHRPIDSDSTITSLPVISQNDTSDSNTVRPGTARGPLRRVDSAPMPDSVTSPLSPPPSPPAQGRNKMKQSAAKSVRMTDDGNPFTKELGELFASLVVTLPMTAHRVRFTKVDETFSSEEAIMNLGSLKSSQSHRMPDPKDPTRWVVTTAITTFSMPKEMARSVCQRFLEARFIESADGRLVTNFISKGGVWQLTPKGVNIVHRWCSRIGVNSRQLEPLLRRDQMHLVVLEREDVTDKLSQDKSTIEVIFRRFAGQDGPNVKASVQNSDSDSIHDYETGLLGVKVARDRKVLDRVIPNTFTGKAASDWLLDCCTTIDRRETYQLAELFIKHKLIWAVVEDRVFMHQHPAATLYQPTKNAIYAFTERGQKLCGWPDKNPRTSTTEASSAKKDTWASKDSNTTRLNMILQDPALRLLFREFLRQSLCEENLTFYQDVREFTTGYRQLENAGSLDRADAVQETLAAAYGTCP
jgi:GTPase-activating protein SST2